MIELILMGLLIVLNGVFAGAEIAIVTLRKGRIDELAKGGHGGARAVLSLRSQPERFLATVQVGITVVGATTAAFGGAAIARRLEPLFARVPWFEEHAEGTALALVVAAVSFLSIVVGELVPKSLALRSAERYALVVARPLLALSWLARPIVWLLSASANLLLKPFGDSTTFTEARHSARELQVLVDKASQAGTIPPDAGEIVSRALDLPELTASDVMVPRQDVVMIARRATHDEIRRILLEHRYSRLPIYETAVDNVVGYVTVKDVLALAWERDLILLHDIIRPAFFVPETKPVVALMNEMRAQHIPFAIVVDEHGGMAGIVTLEDLVEEIVGDIATEHARGGRNAIEKQADGSAIVSGTTPIREINRALGIALPEDGDWNTIAGLCLALAEGVPSSGDSFLVASRIRLEILDASARRVRAIRIRVER